MEIKTENKTLTITIKENEDLFIYNKITSQKDIKKYLSYLFNLDNELNGTDQEYYVYSTVDQFEKEIKNKKAEELSQVKKQLISDMSNYISYLDEAIPSEFKNKFLGPDDGVINIPSDGIIPYLLMLSERLQVIERYTKHK